MRWRVLIWPLLVGALLVMFWCGSRERTTFHNAALYLHQPGGTNVLVRSSTLVPKHSAGRTRYRLTNSSKSIDELLQDPNAILLENAFIDVRSRSPLPIPSELRAHADPHTYIVQSKTIPDDAFRLVVTGAGARIVAYIPNNAYLVRAESELASKLGQSSLVAAVIPFEPYFKIKSSLLDLVLQEPSAHDTEISANAIDTSSVMLNALLFTEQEDTALKQLKELNVRILNRSSSPFGTLYQLACPRRNLATVAQLAAVQEMELLRTRVPANDLSRVRIGVTSDSRTTTNYLGLTGSNVLVNVNDLGVDAAHPDLLGRVSVDVPSSGVDTDGHGTHVAAIIAGNGSQSLTVASAPGSVLPPVSLQFRGLAPQARIFSISVQSETRSFVGDPYLQQQAANHNARISNNSWHYSNDHDYDLGAASYDAAVRDALPGVSGEQPVLFVFAAGNTGRGNDDGTGGVSGTIQSPGTAKNVITVGAIEQPRFITNQTWRCSNSGSNILCQTNTPWLALTDSSNQVAAFSSRGNVGPGLEGSSGRFKPDLVAPGTFVVSARSSSWDQAAYYSASNSFVSLNPDPNYFLVLSNLNQGLGSEYRFESGTSLATADVAGLLALVQEFFEQRLSRTNSPALMKAFLINGARSVAAGYDFQSAIPTNSQGWGLIDLPSALPACITNTAGTNRSIWFFDQSPAETLSTGQQRTWFISVSPAARALPLRLTLVWTDPPANPIAGVKLVNDLDLVVTNLDSGQVFWGNDFPIEAKFNAPWQPGTPPHLDRINNVENVFLGPGLGTNYSVTVSGRRVGVSALSGQSAKPVQDYALVISSGDGQSSDGLTLTEPRDLGVTTPFVTFITNTYATDIDTGAVLLQQRVGAGQSGLGTNSIPVPGLTNALLSLGSPNQWHFYVFTNQTRFTNAAFLTFLTQPLSTIPADPDGTGAGSSGLVSLAGADVDLYVSRDSGLTNLDPATLSGADVSLGRGGAETIVYSNATPGLYYIGIKCESLQGAEFGFVADVSLQPFWLTDSQGNAILRGFPQPAVVPAASPAVPGVVRVFFLDLDTTPVRRVILTNTLTSSALSDLQIELSRDSTNVVLSNFSALGPPGMQTLVFDDSGEADVAGSIPSTGPGTLRLFSGQDGAGQWIVTVTSTNSPATNQSSTLFLERQQDPSGGMGATIQPGVCREDFVSIAIQATNFTETVSLVSGTGPIAVQVYPYGGAASNCASLLLTNAGATTGLVVDQTSQPPLNPGLYVLRTCNLGSDPASVVLQASAFMSATPASTNYFASSDPFLIRDDAVSSQTLLVTNTDKIVSVEVGLRIDHPRISDLVLSLIGPDGTRVLLDAGRGDDSTNGMGANAIVTNTTPVSFSGGPLAVTNVFETGETTGSIVINYDFFALPDDMRVYYQDQLLFHSGLVSFGGSTNLSYGPGASTSFNVIMNQGGNPEPNTAWFYSVSATQVEPLYFTFTENTNLTQTPIKFAAPPFTNLTLAPNPVPGATGIFYLPEEPLSRLAGKSASGQWKLEIWDRRSGATNPPPTLISWQLALTLASSQPLPVPLVSMASATNLLGPGQIQWYEVDVPDWVSLVTNSLVSASQPVNLLFNQDTPPTGTNVGDQVLAVKSTSITWTLRTNGVPTLRPGSPYFLGIQNTNATTVGVVFGVQFDVNGVITLISGTPFNNLNPGPLNYSDYYRFVVSSNAARVQFELNAPTNDLTLLAHKGPPLPSLGIYDFISANPGTNDELIVVYDYSRPVSLGPGEWFLTVLNLTGNPAAYSIMATEFPAYGTNILVSAPSVVDDSLCVTWLSLPGIHYFVQAKASLTDRNWITVSPTLTASEVNTTFCIPLSTHFQYFRISEGIVLNPALPIIASIAYTTNATVLQWSAPTNVLFQVQWTPALSPANWQSIPGQVTSTTGSFLFSDDGSQTGGLLLPRFYRLRQLP